MAGPKQNCSPRSLEPEDIHEALGYAAEAMRNGKTANTIDLEDYHGR